MNERIAIGPGKTALLIVEGTHDVDFFEALANQRQIPLDSLQILPLGGKSNLGANLKTLKNDPGFSAVRSIGIVRDADSIAPSEGLEQAPTPVEGSSAANPTAAKRSFQAVCGCLQNAALSVPPRHNDFTDDNPRMGIFIMPNGQSDGMLESLCWQSVSQSPAASCVVGLFDCLRESNVGEMSFSPKAWTHAYIATQPEPDVHVGKAAKKGYWELADAAFADVVRFLMNLSDSTALPINGSS